jgi:chromosome segregation ATPase
VRDGTISALRKEKGELESAVSSKQKIIEGKDGDIKTLNGQKDELDKKLAAAEEDVKAKDNAILTLNREKEALERRASTAESTLRNETTSWSEKKGELEKQVQAVKEESAKALEKAEEKKKQEKEAWHITKTGLEQQVTDVDSLARSRQTKIDELNGEVGSWKEKEAFARRRVSALEDFSTKLTNIKNRKIGELNVENGNHLAAIRNLRRDHQNEQHRANNAEMEITILGAQLESARGDAAAARSSAVVMEGNLCEEIRQWKEVKEQEEKKVERLEKKVKGLEKKIGEKGEEMEMNAIKSLTRQCGLAAAAMGAEKISSSIIKQKQRRVETLEAEITVKTSDLDDAAVNAVKSVIRQCGIMTAAKAAAYDAEKSSTSAILQHLGRMDHLEDTARAAEQRWNEEQGRLKRRIGNLTTTLRSTTDENESRDGLLQDIGVAFQIRKYEGIDVQSRMVKRAITKYKGSVTAKGQLKTTITELKKEIDDKSGKITQLEGDVEAAKSARSDEITQLGKDVEAAKGERDGKEKLLKGVMSAIGVRCRTAYQQQNAPRRAGKRVTKLQQSLRTKESERKSLEQKFTKTRTFALGRCAEVSRLRADVADAEIINQETLTALHDEREESVRLRNDLRDAEDDLEDAESALRVASGEKKRLLVDLENADADLDTAEEVKTGLRDEIARLPTQEAFYALQAEKDKLAGPESEMALRVVELEKTISQLPTQEAFDALHGEKERLTGPDSEMALKVKELEEKIEKLPTQQSFDEMKKEKERLGCEHAALGERVAYFEGQMEEVVSKAAFEAAVAEGKDHLAEVERLRKELEKAKLVPAPAVNTPAPAVVTTPAPRRSAILPPSRTSTGTLSNTSPPTATTPTPAPRGQTAIAGPSRTTGGTSSTPSTQAYTFLLSGDVASGPRNSNVAAGLKQKMATSMTDWSKKMKGWAKLTANAKKRCAVLRTSHIGTSKYPLESENPKSACTYCTANHHLCVVIGATGPTVLPLPASDRVGVSPDSEKYYIR